MRTRTALPQPTTKDRQSHTRASTFLVLLFQFACGGCASEHWANDLAPGVVYNPSTREVSPTGALLFKYVGDRSEDPNAIGPTFMFGGTAFGTLGGEDDSKGSLELVAGAGFYIDADKFYVAFGWTFFPEPDKDDGSPADGNGIGQGPFFTIGIQ